MSENFSKRFQFVVNVIKCSEHSLEIVSTDKRSSIANIFSGTYSFNEGHQYQQNEALRVAGALSIELCVQSQGIAAFIDFISSFVTAKAAAASATFRCRFHLNPILGDVYHVITKEKSQNYFRTQNRKMNDFDFVRRERNERNVEMAK